MNTIIAGAIVQGFAALTEIWRQHANKPPTWEPTDADWDELEAWANRTPQDIKDEAKQSLGGS